MTLYRDLPVQIGTMLLPLLGDIVTQGTVILRFDQPDPDWVEKAYEAYENAQKENTILTQL